VHNFRIFPALDILNGRAVRLTQGDYAQVTDYGDPLDLARRWKDAGTRWLHLVDLDGAKEGFPANRTLVEKIVAATGLHIQLGGGIRNSETIERWIESGVERVILGTVAQTDPAVVGSAVVRFGADAVVVSVDTRGGKVATEGWTEQTGQDALTLIRDMQALGVRRFIYTDIAKDGMLAEPDYAAIKALQDAAGTPLIVAGSVGGAEICRNLAALGAAGGIVGKALYENQVDLPALLREFPQ
jgi:phosphoribosylformimino-5-aminoimidazole carboxamide ribotide isomerase